MGLADKQARGWAVASSRHSETKKRLKTREAPMQNLSGEIAHSKHRVDKKTVSGFGSIIITRNFSKLESASEKIPTRDPRVGI
jgi:hypothetical protein